MPQVYAHLRSIAGRAWQVEGGASVHPTLLVHEVYLRFARSSYQWESQSHLVAVAARAMRQLLADRARRKGRIKHGGDQQRVTLTGVGVGTHTVDLLAADQALSQLEQVSPRAAEVFVLRSLGGLTVAETARLLKVSERTIKSESRFAKAWLKAQMEG